MSPTNTTRLNKLLALRLGISRREADNLIKNKKVIINGSPAELGYQVTSDETIEVEGRLLPSNTKLTYIALNKPVNYVCSRRKQGETPTVYSLLPKELHDLKLVGRLDKDSSGLILLTNDGDFAHSMTHPSFAKTKIYEIKLNKELSTADFEKVTKLAVRLDDGPSKFSLDSINDHNFEWKVTMVEGRNHQIHRTFEVLGYQVLKLYRTNFGPFSIEGLKPKKYKEIFPEPI